MGVTVSVNNPSYPEGYVFAIDHIGEIPNGGSLEVDEANERMFVSVRGQTVEDAFKGSEVVSVSGSSSVDNIDEIIGDRQQPGPEQGVSPKEEVKEESATATTSRSSKKNDNTTTEPTTEEGAS